MDDQGKIPVNFQGEEAVEEFNKLSIGDWFVAAKITKFLSQDTKRELFKIDIVHTQIVEGHNLAIGDTILSGKFCNIDQEKAEELGAAMTGFVRLTQPLLTSVAVRA
jgi:hypothetical protein